MKTSPTAVKKRKIRVLGCYMDFFFFFKFQESAQGEISCLREVQCAVFSFLHQAFIKDPYLAKLLHFQVKSTFVLTSALYCIALN